MSSDREEIGKDNDLGIWRQVMGPASPLTCSRDELRGMTNFSFVSSAA